MLRFSIVVIFQVPLKIGRAFKNDKSSPDNGYFDCKVLSRLTLNRNMEICNIKVLSKAHAMLLYEEDRYKISVKGFI